MYFVFCMVLNMEKEKRPESSMHCTVSMRVCLGVRIRYVILIKSQIADDVEKVHSQTQTPIVINPFIRQFSVDTRTYSRFGRKKNRIEM